MKRTLIAIALLALGAVGYVGCRIAQESSKTLSDDPLVWEDAIVAFEEEDRESPPPARPFVFVGSSSIRLWESLAEDMAPLPTVRRSRPLP